MSGLRSAAWQGFAGWHEGNEAEYGVLAYIVPEQYGRKYANPLVCYPL